MVFTIDVENELDSVFRLKNNGSWQSCANKTVLLDDDFRSPDHQTLIDLQTPDRQILINNLQYTVDPEMGIEVGNPTHLTYSVCCFRSVFPTHPMRPQMETAFLNGDDNIDNTLILGVDGLFRLVRLGIFSGNPEIVVQFERFGRGNGYVGAGIQDDGFDQYMGEYFRTAMHCWRNHLRYKEIHYQSDELESDDLDLLLDIYDDLSNLQQNFQPR
jgi:hypothetical protein